MCEAKFEIKYNKWNQSFKDNELASMTTRQLY